MTDINLLQGLRKQSPKAQQQMLERYGNDVYAQVARLVPGRENAEEVYQDVFIKVFKIIMMYDAEKSSLRTWISRIAYNESISFLRHKSMPVINKRFEWQTELTKPCVGRLRCIFPDGELCSAWIDLDFVPGETYNITVHNGYYDEDKDYERRVGRQSGKSLIEPRAAKVVEDTVPVYYQAHPVRDEFDVWRQSFNEQQEMQFQMKAERLQMSVKKLGGRYEFIKMLLNGSNSDHQNNETFEEILKLNQEIEARWQDFFKFFEAKNMPKLAYPKVYKEIIEIYSTQLHSFDVYYQQRGSMSKIARKVNAYIIQQNEKYMDELEKSME